MVKKRIHGHNPPDPNAKCICGSDDDSGFRYSIVCPKHDGEYFEMIVDDEAETLQTDIEVE